MYIYVTGHILGKFLRSERSPSLFLIQHEGSTTRPGFDFHRSTAPRPSRPQVKELEDWTHDCAVPPCRDKNGRALMQPNEHGDWAGEISRKPCHPTFFFLNLRY